jgi:hypothetical protein
MLFKNSADTPQKTVPAYRDQLVDSNCGLLSLFNEYLIKHTDQALGWKTSCGLLPSKDKVSRLDLGPTQPSVLYIARAFYPGGEWLNLQGHKSDHSPFSGAEVKNV